MYYFPAQALIKEFINKDDYKFCLAKRIASIIYLKNNKKGLNHWFNPTSTYEKHAL